MITRLALHFQARMLLSSDARVETIFSDPARRCVIVLGYQTEKFFPPILLLAILIDPAIQVSTSILVHLVDTEELVGVGHESDP